MDSAAAIIAIFTFLAAISFLIVMICIKDLFNIFKEHDRLKRLRKENKRKFFESDELDLDDDCTLLNFKIE